MNKSISTKQIFIIVAITISISLSIFYVLSRLPSKELDSEVGSLLKDLDEVKDYRQHLMAVNDAELLSESWRKLMDLAKYYDVEILPINKSEFGNREFYTGPLVSWSAELKGKTGDLLTLLKVLETEVPVYQYAFSIESQIMKIDVSVVGI